MNKYLTLLLLIFSTTSAICQKQDTVYLDYKGHKTTKQYAFRYSIRFFDPEMNLYYFMDYGLIGKLLHEGYSSSRRRDRKEGKHIWYYNQGKIRATAYFKHNLQYGPYTEYYKNGHFKSSTVFQMSKKNGIYQEVFQNGRKNITGQYENNMKNGIWKYYYNTPVNSVSAEITYRNNIIVKKKYLNEDGSVLEDIEKGDCEPQYPGGINALRFIIYRNLKYPGYLRKSRIHRNVIIAFSIDEEGDMQNIHVVKRTDTYFNNQEATKESVMLKEANNYFDNEALRLMKLAKRQWIPGKKFNRPAAYEMSYIIVFEPSGSGLF